MAKQNNLFTQYKNVSRKKLVLKGVTEKYGPQPTSLSPKYTMAFNMLWLYVFLTSQPASLTDAKYIDYIIGMKYNETAIMGLINKFASYISVLYTNYYKITKNDTLFANNMITAINEIAYGVQNYWIPGMQKIPKIQIPKMPEFNKIPEARAVKIPKIPNIFDSHSSFQIPVLLQKKNNWEMCTNGNECVSGYCENKTCITRKNPVNVSQKALTVMYSIIEKISKYKTTNTTQMYIDLFDHKTCNDVYTTSFIQALSMTLGQENIYTALVTIDKNIISYNEEDIKLSHPDDAQGMLYDIYENVMKNGYPSVLALMSTEKRLGSLLLLKDSDDTIAVVPYGIAYPDTCRMFIHLMSQHPRYRIVPYSFIYNSNDSTFFKSLYYQELLVFHEFWLHYALIMFRDIPDFYIDHLKYIKHYFYEHTRHSNGKELLNMFAAWLTHSMKS